ncbi:MAG: 50S ribosomal protein L17 [Candidatus Latescibacteria bacterium]|nr:50S ribosomal protein L17 [Candidatus Latescibacterota bacterium]
MRHLKQGRKLGRTSSHRKAMLRNLVTSLVEHEGVKTTDAKAKEVRPLVEKLITLAKRGDLHARRQALAVLRGRKVAAKLFDTIAPRFADREGGYTRIIKIGQRKGDGASVSLIEILGRERSTAKAETKKGA